MHIKPSQFVFNEKDEIAYLIYTYPVDFASWILYSHIVSAKPTYSIENGWTYQAVYEDKKTKDTICRVNLGTAIYTTSEPISNDNPNSDVLIEPRDYIGVADCSIFLAKFPLDLCHKDGEVITFFSDFGFFIDIIPKLDNLVSVLGDMNILYSQVNRQFWTPVLLTCLEEEHLGILKRMCYDMGGIILCNVWDWILKLGMEVSK